MYLICSAIPGIKEFAFSSLYCSLVFDWLHVIFDNYLTAYFVKLVSCKFTIISIPVIIILWTPGPSVKAFLPMTAASGAFFLQIIFSTSRHILLAISGLSFQRSLDCVWWGLGRYSWWCLERTLTWQYLRAQSCLVYPEHGWRMGWEGEEERAYFNVLWYI